MKVLLAHKFYHPVGGTEVYFQQLADILARHGDETVPFALADPRNPPSPYARHFLAPLDLRAKGAYRVLNFARILSRTFYSREARRKLAALIREVRPEVAHLQAIENHMSPSIIHELKQHGIPMVQSVNTYKHVCASLRLYLDSDHEICERCAGGRHYHALLTRCLKGSLAASALGMMEMYLHQNLMGIYSGIDRFVVSNDFMRGKMIEAGHAPAKLVTLLNPFDLGPPPDTDTEARHILYFGRVELEKGVFTLLQAMKTLPALKLKVVGDGSQLDACIAWQRAHGGDNVEFVGPKWGADLTPYLAASSVVAVPSEWHEPSPYVIYQALAAGKPVVCTRMGGMPDLVTEESGLLVPPKDPMQLAAALESIAGDPMRARAMGRAARRWAEANLDPVAYYERIKAVYREAGARV